MHFSVGISLQHRRQTPFSRPHHRQYFNLQFATFVTVLQIHLAPTTPLPLAKSHIPSAFFWWGGGGGQCVSVYKGGNVKVSSKSSAWNIILICGMSLLHWSIKNHWNEPWAFTWVEIRVEVSTSGKLSRVRVDNWAEQGRVTLYFNLNMFRLLQKIIKWVKKCKKLDFQC